MSKTKKYWDNEKSRALRALTMRLSRLNRNKKVPSDDRADIEIRIQAAREQIYKIEKKDFTKDHRFEIFDRYGL